MAKTKYLGVYVDKNGQFYYETYLSKDRITGKKIRKKECKKQQEKKFTSAQQAPKELIRSKTSHSPQTVVRTTT